eukprot:Rmarinus@m.12956
MHMLWVSPNTIGDPPCPRGAHTCCVVDEKLYVFGGADKKRELNDVSILDSRTMTWTTPKTKGTAPSPRFGHAVAVVGRKAFIFGGLDGTYRVSRGEYFPLNDLMTYDADTHAWMKIRTRGKPPSPRFGHTLTAVGSVLYVIGGLDDSGCLNDVTAFDTRSMCWSSVKTSGQPPCARATHTTTAFGDKLFVFGGGSDSGCHNDLHCLDLDTMEWTKVLSTGNIPACRTAHTSTPIVNQLFVFGGGDKDRNARKQYNDVRLYDMEMEMWHEPSIHGKLPQARDGHTTVAIGNKLFVFGGHDGETVFGSLHVLLTSPPPAPDPEPPFRLDAPRLHRGVLISAPVVHVGMHFEPRKIHSLHYIPSEGAARKASVIRLPGSPSPEPRAAPSPTPPKTAEPKKRKPRKSRLQQPPQTAPSGATRARRKSLPKAVLDEKFAKLHEHSHRCSDTCRCVLARKREEEVHLQEVEEQKARHRQRRDSILSEGDNGLHKEKSFDRLTRARPPRKKVEMKPKSEVAQLKQTEYMFFSPSPGSGGLSPQESASPFYSTNSPPRTAPAMLPRQAPRGMFPPGTPPSIAPEDSWTGAFPGSASQSSGAHFRRQPPLHSQRHSSEGRLSAKYGMSGHSPSASLGHGNGSQGVRPATSDVSSLSRSAPSTPLMGLSRGGSASSVVPARSGVTSSGRTVGAVQPQRSAGSSPRSVSAWWGLQNDGTPPDSPLVTDSHLFSIPQDESQRGLDPLPLRTRSFPSQALPPTPPDIGSRPGTRGSFPAVGGLTSQANHHNNHNYPQPQYSGSGGSNHSNSTSNSSGAPGAAGYHEMAVGGKPPSGLGLSLTGAAPPTTNSDFPHPHTLAERERGGSRTRLKALSAVGAGLG